MKSKFKFANPGIVKIIPRLADESILVDTSGDHWIWEDGGNTYKIKWDSFEFASELEELLKAFIFHRLETHSPRTVASVDAAFVRVLNKAKLARSLPWQQVHIESFVRNKELIASGGIYTFRKFYTWALGKQIEGFTPEINLLIQELSYTKGGSYDAIYLRQNTLSETDEFNLLKYIEETVVFNDRFLLQANIILQLAFELGPRPIQIYCIEQSDLEIVKSDATTYYSINLAMAKRIRSGLPEKKFRSISNGLGTKIEALIKLNNQILYYKGNSLIRNETGYKRLSSIEIGETVNSQLQLLGFNKGDSITLLRHHFAQTLADLGASAEQIAELLGHNSKVAGRAYVGATPQIAVIKTKALGKNGTYLNLMKMFLTGEAIEKEKSPKDRWVKGMVGNQYIGGIGSCGLPSDTSCPKNPVYSCYTCKKFHPFVDGVHDKVKKALQQQSQYFVDIAEKGLLIENNRSIVQLEATIAAVDSTIAKCNSILDQPS